MISSFDTDLGIGWGVGFDTSRIWVSNPSYLLAADDNLDHAFTPDGTDTGATIDLSGAGLWMGDEALQHRRRGCCGA